MSTGTIIADVVFVLIVASPLVLFVLRTSRIQRDIKRIMSTSVSENPTLVEINELLAAVNERCGAYAFCAERSANVLFRGHVVALVIGSVVSLGVHRTIPLFYRHQSLYALADAPQAEWMWANPDVFSAAHEGIPYSVFWVKRSKLSVATGTA